MPETRQNRTRHQPPTEEGFRPHARYPRLDADAGKTTAPKRPRRPARRHQSGFTATPRTPRAYIRLDSTAGAPSLSARLRNRNLPSASRVSHWLSLAALVGMVGLGVWLLTSNAFHVSKVEVKGSRFLDSQEVLQLTGADKVNIFWLNEDEIARKIQTQPYVLTVHVAKTLPDRLTVEITERRSVLNWKIGSVNYMVDNDGVVLDTVYDQEMTADTKAFPVVQSLDERKLVNGDRVDANAVRSVQTIQTQLREAGFKIAATQYSPTAGLIVVSDPSLGNWKALLGTDAQLDKKISILKGLLADKSIKWSYADLRFVNKPAIQ